MTNMGILTWIVWNIQSYMAGHRAFVQPTGINTSIRLPPVNHDLRNINSKSFKVSSLIGIIETEVPGGKTCFLKWKHFMRNMAIHIQTVSKIPSCINGRNGCVAAIVKASWLTRIFDNWKRSALPGIYTQLDGNKGLKSYVPFSKNSAILTRPACKIVDSMSLCRINAENTNDLCSVKRALLRKIDMNVLLPLVWNGIDLMNVPGRLGTKNFSTTLRNMDIAVFLAVGMTIINLGCGAWTKELPTDYFSAARRRPWRKIVLSY